MALTAEQTKGLQDQFKQLRAQGLDAASATAKLKESMKTAGVYDKAKAIYNAPAAPAAPVVPNTSVPPLPTPAAPRGQSPKVDGTPVNPPAPAATAPVTVNTSVQATPATLNATAGQTDATGMVVPQGMTSFDTSAGKNLSQIQQPIQQVQPVQAPAPAKPSTVSPDKAQEIDRSREIMANLQEGQKNSPQLFKDEATFKQAYGYDTKPVEEQAQLDAFWQAQNKRSADQLIDMAIARQDLSAYKGTPEYLTAQRVGKAVLDYSKMTPALLAQRMEAMESDLLPGSKAYDVLSKANPQLVAEAERIKDANRRSGIIGYDANGKATTNRIPDAETNISDSLTNGVSESAIPSLASALNTPEITKAREAASATKTQLNELYDTVEGIEDDVRAELKGTGATESYIRALINERSKPLLKQVNSLERKYANEAGDLKALSDVATDAFKYEAEVASERRRFEQSAILAQMQTEASQTFQSKQQAAQFAQQEKMAQLGYVNDALRTEDQQKFQMDMQKTQYEQQFKMENFKQAIEQSGYDIKSVDGMTTYSKKGNPKDNMTFDANGTLVSVGGKSVPVRTEQVADAYSVSKEATSDKVGSIGGECTKWASDKMQEAGFGRALSEGLRSNEDDTVAFKASKTNTSVPSIGSAIALNNGTKYGHWGIVTGIGGDGTITYTSSNEKGDKKITSSSIKANDRNVIGYYNPNFTGKTAAASTEFGPADIQVFNAMTPTAQGKAQNDPKFRAFVEQKKKVMDDKNSEIADILEFSRGGKDIAVTQAQSLEKYQSTLSKLEDITKQISSQSTGPIVGRLRGMNPYDTSAQTLRATLQSLIPGLARGVYGEVGVLTDNDIANYAKTIPNLNSTAEVNKAVLAMTLDTLAGGYKRQLATLAKSGVDVSGLTSTYDELKAQAESAKSELGIGGNARNMDTKSEDDIWNSL